MALKPLRKFKKSKQFSIEVFRKFFVGLGIFIGVAVVVLGIFLLRIQNVSFELNSVNCTNQSQLESDLKLKGNNIFLQNTEIVAKTIKEKYSCVQSAKVTKIYPNNLKVEIQGREPVVVINFVKIEQNKNLDLFSELIASESATESAKQSVVLPDPSTGSKFIADRTGYIFETFSDQNNLPVVNYFGDNLGLGKKVEDDAIDKMFQIIAKLNEFVVPLGGVNIIGEKMTFDSQPKLTFSLTKDVLRQLTTLQLILQEAKINSKTIESVDLRFDKSVVLYSSKK